MASGAGSLLFHPFNGDLAEDHPAIRSLQNSFRYLSRTCSNIQILQLANTFRQYSDDQILRWAEDHRPHSFSDSSSNRNSLFSIRSASSQATTLSNRSQSRYTHTERPPGGIYPHTQDHLQRQVPVLHQVAGPVNQGSPTPSNKNPPPLHICVACNIAFANKSTLSRHQKEHCERKVEWICWGCDPMKNFYRKDKLSQHHLDNHGGACVRGCKQQRGGLCDRHLARSALELQPKMAWGCPCCLRCFDSFDDWTRHGGNHPVQNDKVVGWSLSTMVQSLLLQPFLNDAIRHLPWQVCDLDKAKPDVCQSLRDALERHKLPNAVQGHYDYRHLQLPEALAQYTFRLVAYGGPYENDVSVATNKALVRPTSEKSHAEMQRQHSSPSDQPVPDTPASGYWNPEDPFTYHERSPHHARQGTVRGTADRLPVDCPGNGLLETKRSGASAHSLPHETSAQAYVQVVRSNPAAFPGDQSLSQQSFAVRASQEFNCVEKRGRSLSMKKSLQNLVHRSSSGKSVMSHSEPIPPLPARPDGRALEIGKTAATFDHSKDSLRIEPMEIFPNSPGQARLSGRMSDVQMDLFLTWPPEEQHDS